MKVKIVGVFSICTVFTTVNGAVVEFAARADDSGTAVYSGVSRLRQACGAIGDDPRLTLAAQRHANDMLQNGLDGHIGSDGAHLVRRTGVAVPSAQDVPIGQLSITQFTCRSATSGLTPMLTNSCATWARDLPLLNSFSINETYGKSFASAPGGSSASLFMQRR
jgi:hypothetical protein